MELLYLEWRPIIWNGPQIYVKPLLLYNGVQSNMISVTYMTAFQHHRDQYVFYRHVPTSALLPLGATFPYM